MKKRKYFNQDFYTPKRAFDEVMEHYTVAPPSVQSVNMASSGGTRNPSNPSLTDFKVDVEEQIDKVIKNAHHRALFIIRYGMGIENLSKADQHVFALYEQRIGRLFIKHEIWPLRRYFIAIREKRK